MKCVYVRRHLGRNVTFHRPPGPPSSSLFSLFSSPYVSNRHTDVAFCCPKNLFIAVTEREVNIVHKIYNYLVISVSHGTTELRRKEVELAKKSGEEERPKPISSHWHPMPIQTPEALSLHLQKKISSANSDFFATSYFLRETRSSAQELFYRAIVLLFYAKTPGVNNVDRGKLNIRCKSRLQWFTCGEFVLWAWERGRILLPLNCTCLPYLPLLLFLLPPFAKWILWLLPSYRSKEAETEKFVSLYFFR